MISGLWWQRFEEPSHIERSVGPVRRALRYAVCGAAIRVRGLSVRWRHPLADQQTRGGRQLVLVGYAAPAEEYVGVEALPAALVL